ncbi:MAG: endonuclease/exonuclease/phosphatase family protein [Candidatus Doudnabacteria bacterium]|nr:endonuclease/exonuclease/phosphatase family protein [Candidatus Doudnabacteria bacterium]
MKIAAYNILAGGFNGYGSAADKPERLALLQRAIQEIDADVIGLSDTFRWVDVFTEQEIKQLFGYEYVSFIHMNDVRVDKRIGVAVLSRVPVERFETVRLATRDCIKAVISMGVTRVALYTAYLDDLAERVRVEQVQVLLEHISEDAQQGMESIVMGDLNMLTPEDASKKEYGLDLLIEAGLDVEAVLMHDPYHKAAFDDLHAAQALPLLLGGGLVEPVGAELHATAFTKIHELHFPFPVLRLDHIVHTAGVASSGFLVHKGGIFEEASDHYPISCQVQ